MGELMGEGLRSQPQLLGSQHVRHCEWAHFHFCARVGGRRALHHQGAICVMSSRAERVTAPLSPTYLAFPGRKHDVIGP